MVGIDKIREYLGEYKSNYVIIGGTAVNLNLSDASIEERSTKDVDIIVICEAMTPEYLSSFWEMIRAGGYSADMVQDQDGEMKRVFYRFEKPEDPSFPACIELFSRSMDDLGAPADMHPIHIVSPGDVPSFSVLLLADDYYRFAVSHAKDFDGVRALDPCSLILLKAKAYVSNFRRKESGEDVQQDDIDKHKRDVYRMSFFLEGRLTEPISDSMKEDLRSFIELVKDHPVGTRSIAKRMALQEVMMEDFIEKMTTYFGL